MEIRQPETSTTFEIMMKARIEDGVVYSPYPGCEIPDTSLYSVVKEYLQKFPEGLAMVDDTLSLTRGDLLVRLQRYAAGFQANGIVPGDRVCVHMGNSVENFVAFFGCIFSGATVVLAKTSLTERELHYQMADIDVTHVLTDTTYVEKVLSVSKKMKIKGLFIMGEAPGFVSASLFAEMDESEFREIAVVDPENTVIALAYTSGTTGLPKAVEITHKSLVGAIYTHRAYQGRDVTDITLTWNPITHTAGVMSVISLLMGATCVITPPALNFQQFVEVVRQYKVTVLTFFPTRLQYMVNQLLSTGTRLDTVRKIVIAGGVLMDTVARNTLSAFPNLLSLQNYYGMTESNSCVCMPPPDTVCYANIGFPAPMVQIKVLDIETGQKLGPNKQGELCFNSPCPVRGYYKKPEATAQFKDKDGWCHSGDLVFYDEEGRFYFVERMKEMIKCKDNQVVPGELEDLILKKHDGVAEVVVVGLPHPDYGEMPAAFVVLKQTHQTPGKVTEEEIKAIISESCAENKHLSGGVFFVESLPKTETGKVRRRTLVEGYKKHLKEVQSL